MPAKHLYQKRCYPSPTSPYKGKSVCQGGHVSQNLINNTCYPEVFDGKLLVKPHKVQMYPGYYILSSPHFLNCLSQQLDTSICLKATTLIQDPSTPQGCETQRSASEWSYSKFKWGCTRTTCKGCSKKVLLVPEWPCFTPPFHAVGTCDCLMALGCWFLAAAGLEIVSTKIVIQVEKRSRAVIKMALFLNLVYHYPSCLETSTIHHWWLEFFS